MNKRICYYVISNVVAEEYTLTELTKNIQNILIRSKQKQDWPACALLNCVFCVGESQTTQNWRRQVWTINDDRWRASRHRKGHNSTRESVYSDGVELSWSVSL